VTSRFAGFTSSTFRFFDWNCRALPSRSPGDSTQDSAQGFNPDSSAKNFAMPYFFSKDGSHRHSPTVMTREVECRRHRAQRLSNRQLPQLKAETMLLRRRRRSRLWSITIRNCLFTLFRIEDRSNEN
jgi:hypothetical protein